MDLQRRVASKRNRKKSGKTPLKCKQGRRDDTLGSNAGGVRKQDGCSGAEGSGSTWSCARGGGRSASDASGINGKWIENSFGKNEIKANGNLVSMVAPPVSSAAQRKSIETQDRVRESAVMPTPRRSQRRSTNCSAQKQIMTQQHPTSATKRVTRSARKGNRAKKSASDSGIDVCGSASESHTGGKSVSSDLLWSELDGFNDSDTLFAELDVQPLPAPLQGHNRPIGTNVSHSPADLFASSSDSSSGKLFDAAEILQKALSTSHSGTKNHSVQNAAAVFNSAFRRHSTTAIPTPQNIKTLSQVLNDHNYSPPRPDGDESPVRTSRALKEKFNQAMMQNAEGTAPYSERQQQLKEEATREALRLAEEARAAGERDLGPFYGLPSRVRQLLHEQRGISKLYDWQHECLSLKQVTERKNLIYTLPTSGGKTLVAEILILKELLCREKDAMLILPYVSIVQEKVRGMSGFALDLDFCVEEYAAHKGQIPPRNRRKKRSLFICTIEKAHTVINSLIESKRIDSIGLCVVDELHMLGEGGSRGACLEMSLAKLMHMNSELQVIGMSATLSNITDLEAFLDAHVYSNDFRPVELTEYVKVEDVVYRVNNAALVPEDRLVHDRHVMFNYGLEEKKLDPDHVAALAGEVVPEHSCLVFCPTKKNCENVAQLLCKMLPRSMLDHKVEDKKALYTALWHEGGGEICPTLRRTVPFGIAYHHSGLTMDERKLIEEAYSEGTLCLLCCTSTLAAGVNLPAKRVILRSPYVGMEFLSRSQYKQMTGRAGRAGIDTSGESILLVQKRDAKKVLSLATGPMEYCESSLMYDGSKGMRQLLLTTVGLQITPTVQSAVTFLRRTLCYVQSQKLGITDIDGLANRTLDKLGELGLVTRSRPGASQDPGRTSRLDPDHVLDVTPLGRAVFKGSIEADLGPQLYMDVCLALPPLKLSWSSSASASAQGSIDCDRGPLLYRDLREASESLVVHSHLHLLYLVTPYDMVANQKPNWMLYLDELGSLDQAELKVASLVGVSESYVARQISGHWTKKGVDAQVVCRFYLTLVLYNLWKQKTIWTVASKFQMARGFVQNLLNSATSFASCVQHFCQELPEFWAYQDLFGNFVKRLSYCHVADLIPLLEVPGVKIGRARQLYKAGYKTLQHVASADPEQLVVSIKHMPRKTAKQIVTSAQMVLQERAEALMEEAEDIITIPSDMPVAHEVEIPTSQQFQEELEVSFSQL